MLIELTAEDRALIKRVVIVYHGAYIKPADRLMKMEEKCPWDFPIYDVPEKWLKEAYNEHNGNLLLYDDEV